MWELDHTLNSINRLKSSTKKRKYKNTKVAMVELKRLKFFLQQLDSYNAQLLNIELAQHSITDAIFQRQIVLALGKTAKTLTSIHKE